MEIKKLLIERQRMSLSDLSRHFHVSEAVMAVMLEQWQKKGRIIRSEVSGACGSACGSCSESSEAKTFYRWKSVAEKPIFMRVTPG